MTNTVNVAGKFHYSQREHGRMRPLLTDYWTIRQLQVMWPSPISSSTFRRANVAEFKKGSKVMLKSGGPIMTVQNIGDYSISAGLESGALCVWFDGNKPMEKVFDLEALEIYREEY